MIRGEYIREEPIIYQFPRRTLSLYDLPVSAGTGQFLDSDRFSEIEVGDEVEVDFYSGIITDKTTGKTYKGQAFPPFMQKIIKAEGLINYINENTK